MEALAEGEKVRTAYRSWAVDPDPHEERRGIYEQADEVA